jgi:hypothetical protein
MNTTLQSPSISEMINAGFDLIYTLDTEQVKSKPDFFKNCQGNWFFSPTKAGCRNIIECWKKSGDFEEDVQIAEANWI